MVGGGVAVVAVAMKLILPLPFFTLAIIYTAVAIILK